MHRSGVVGIDASRIGVSRLTGTETYTLELLRALAELDPPDAFELYFNSNTPPEDAPPLGTPICVPFPRFWTQARLSLEMARRRPSLLFVPAHVIPLIHPRSVVTIHDLGYRAIPEAHPPGDRRRLDWSTRWNARSARRIIAISHATKRDLVEVYGVPPDRVDVIHHGVSSRFRSAPAGDVARVRAKLKLDGPYLLAVGTIQPRKNYGRLAAALARLAPIHREVALVIAGKRGWLADQVEAEIRSAGAANVRFLDYVHTDDLPALYSSAAAVCQPSLYEGFGMPVLEAMACGTPVVASNTSSLPEVAGDAALLVDPADVDAIAYALSKVLADRELRERLVAAGIERAAGFTWRRCAERTLAVLRAVRDA